jgi:NTP pyrophosphatase (non-canonical NTP hydrolase)
MKHVNINELIGKIRQWGVDRYICGPEGEGTLGSQLAKAQEELQEAFDALYDDDKHEIADAIGDVTVCLVLAAERAGLIYEDCVEQAWNEIKDRKGRMINGTFVKNAK